ncbi:MAG: TlpA family protein disulfide reductase [Candidatus Glassbacteria bacterium]|nr:TlpA family protein disulfide reductase [Candidatus Glassbacteria bacterium]
MKTAGLLGPNAALAVMALFFACGAGGSSSDSSPPAGAPEARSSEQAVARAGGIAAEGKLAPDFTLARIDGGEVVLSGLRGKVVILDFWATWCPPCVKGVPEFVELYNEYESQGLDVIGISVDRGPGVVKKFVEKNKVTYPVVMADRPVVDAYQPMYVPTTYIIDRQGKVVTKVVGYNPKSFFVSEIKKLF